MTYRCELIPHHYNRTAWARVTPWHGEFALYLCKPCLDDTLDRCDDVPGIEPAAIVLMRDERERESARWDW